MSKPEYHLLLDALLEAIDLRVQLYKETNNDSPNLSNLEIVEKDEYASKWLKLLVNKDDNPTKLSTGQIMEISKSNDTTPTYTGCGTPHDFAGNIRIWWNEQVMKEKEFNEWINAKHGDVPVDKRTLCFSEKDMFELWESCYQQKNEEIKWRDEMLAAHEAKIKALSAHATCGCSYDKPDDVCIHHSPQLAEAKAMLAALRGFAIEMFHYDLAFDESFLKYGLIDDTGNPTALLTGEERTTKDVELDS